MSGVLGLVLLASPFVTLPAASAFGGDASLVALGSDPAQMRLFCYSTRCNDIEWRQARTGQPLRLADGSRPARPALPGRDPWIQLYAPAIPRDSRASYANDWRIGARYGIQALRDGPVQLGVQLGAGYRMAHLGDDGIHLPGPVLRGALDFGRRIGDRAWWNQHIQFETGQGQTFVKQTIGVDVSLWPSWTLETDFAIRHDEVGTSGTESAESSVQLRRRF